MKSGFASRLDLVPLERVAKRLGLSRQRVQQIESEALAKLRRNPEALELLRLAARSQAGYGARDVYARTPHTDWNNIKAIPTAGNAEK